MNHMTVEAISLQIDRSSILFSISISSQGGLLVLVGQASMV